ncbi:hypothetical protein FF38_01633, partial [Lucilia cuprina]
HARFVAHEAEPEGLHDRQDEVECAHAGPPGEEVGCAVDERGAGARGAAVGVGVVARRGEVAVEVAGVGRVVGDLGEAQGGRVQARAGRDTDGGERADGDLLDAGRRDELDRAAEPSGAGDDAGLGKVGEDVAGAVGEHGVDRGCGAGGDVLRGAQAVPFAGGEGHVLRVLHEDRSRGAALADDERQSHVGLRGGVARAACCGGDHEGLDGEPLAAGLRREHDGLLGALVGDEVLGEAVQRLPVLSEVQAERPLGDARDGLDAAADVTDDLGGRGRRESGRRDRGFVTFRSDGDGAGGEECGVGDFGHGLLLGCGVADLLDGDDPREVSAHLTLGGVAPGEVGGVVEDADDGARDRVDLLFGLALGEAEVPQVGAGGSAADAFVVDARGAAAALLGALQHGCRRARVVGDVEADGVATGLVEVGGDLARHVDGPFRRPHGGRAVRALAVLNPLVAVALALLGRPALPDLHGDAEDGERDRVVEAVHVGALDRARCGEGVGGIEEEAVLAKPDRDDDGPG